jgi:GNAT superfamily N-acetyltransferase
LFAADFSGAQPISGLSSTIVEFLDVSLERLSRCSQTAVRVLDDLDEKNMSDSPPEHETISVPSEAPSESAAKSRKARLKGTSFLLSRAYDSILASAFVSDIYGVFDEEIVEVWLDCLPVGPTLSVPLPGYDIVAADGERPLVLLRHDGEAVGYYVDMGLWIDPAHRGHDLGVQLILAAAEHFGRKAFINDEMEDPRNGLGFSEAGYAAHERARYIAAELIRSR